MSPTRTNPKLSKKPSMAIVRGSRPNLAELAVYRPFLAKFDLTFFFAGIDAAACKQHMEAIGLGAIRLVPFTTVSDLIPFTLARRALDYKVGIGTYMISRLTDVLAHDYVNVVDPLFGFSQQIAQGLRPDQKLIIVRWENIYGRYDLVWTASRRATTVLQRADRIICVSQAAAFTLPPVDGLASKTVQIYPGIDLPDLSSRASNNHNLPDAPHPSLILFVGRPQWTKGLHILLVALHILRSIHHQKVELWVVGDGHQSVFSKLVSELELTDSVRFLGSLANSKVRAAMMQSDIFAFPSLITPNWMEQYGFALVEAMACGLPVVTSDSGSIREVCGDAAVYAATGNAHSLAVAIMGLFADRPAAQQRGAALRARAFQEFNADVQGAKMLEALP